MNAGSGIGRLVTALAWRFAVVLAAAAALYAATTVSLVKPVPEARTTGQEQAKGAAASAADVAASPGETFPAIAEHPLFYPSRMPWLPPLPPEPAPVSTAPSPLTNYALIGVVVSGATRSALIRPPGAAKTIRLEEGQELDGWKLQEITRTRLRFAAGDASYEMIFPKPSESAR